MVWWPFVKPFIPYLIGAAVIGGAVMYGDRNGYNRAMLDIATDNQEAKERADAVRGKPDECRAAGGVWDQANGVCQRSL